MWMALLIACGGGSTSFDSGLRPGKKIADLDESEACEISKEVQRWLREDFQTSSCALEGIASGVAAEVVDDDYAMACETAVSECIARIDPLEEIDCSTVEVNLPPNCNATVREVEACFSDVVDELQVFASLECTPLSPEDFDAFTNLDPEALPESCETLRASCPGFY